MKFYFILAINFLCLSLAAQNTTANFITITGNIADMNDSAELSLFHPSSSAPVGTAFAKKKTFKLIAPVNFAGLSRITIKAKTGVYNYDLFAGPENITLTGTLKQIDKLSVKGSKYQPDFKSIIKKFEPQFKALNKLNQDIQVENNPEKRNTLFLTSSQLVNKIGEQLDSLLKLKAASPVSAFMLYITKDLYKENPMVTSNRISSLKNEAATSLYTESIKNEISQLMVGAIGSPAIEFTQNDTVGKPVSLSSFRGQYVLLDFWASWCGPCRHENPTVVAAFNKFKSKKFTVLGVSLDKPEFREKWLAAIQDDGLNWTHVSDLKFWQNEVAVKYGVGSIPQNYLIDPKGIIVAKNLRGPALEAKLCELLGCN